MPFDAQPHLVGEWIALRPLRHEDRDALYRVASAPLIWEQHPVKDRHEEPIFRAFFAESMAPENLRSQRAVAKIGGQREPGLDDQGRIVFRIRAHAFAERERCGAR